MNNEKVKASDIRFYLSMLLFGVVAIFYSGMTIYSGAGDFISSEGTVFVGLTRYFIIYAGASVLLYIALKPLRKAIMLVYACAATLSVVYGFFWVKNFGEIRNGHFTNEATLNLSPFFVVAEAGLIAALLAVIIYLSLKKAKQLRDAYAILLLIVVGATVYTMTAYKGQESKYTSWAENTELPTYNDEIMSFSKERNIIWFLLDMYPGFAVPELLKRHPELKNYLDGFTWYRNTVSVSGGTYTSMPALYGGHNYTPYNVLKRKAKSYLAESTKAANILPDAMGAEGYDISLITENFRYWNDLKKRKDVRFGDPADYVGYWARKKGVTIKGIMKNNEKIETYILFRLSLFRIVPTFVKQYLYKRRYIENSIGHHAWINDRLMCYDYKYWPVLDMLPELANTDNDKPAYKFFYSALTHNPYGLNTNCELEYQYGAPKDFPKDDKRLMYQELYCATKALTDFFNWMKQERIYDKSKIVVVSDHGRNGGGHSHSIGTAFATLFVKDCGQRGDLKISNRIMSNADVPSILCSGLPGGCEGLSDKDPIKNDLKDRIMYYQKLKIGRAESKNEYFSAELLETYRIKGNIYNKKDWTKVDFH